MRLLVTLLLASGLTARATSTPPTVWVEMSQTAGPQILWLPEGVNGVQFFSAKVDGDWDVMAGGWKSLHRVTKGVGVQASPEWSRLARKTGGRVSLIVQRPANLAHTSCLKGVRDGAWVVTLCLKAVEGGRGGAPF